MLFFGKKLSKGPGFTPPSPGKAVVYFTRVTKYGFAISYEYFHEDKYIGIFKGKNYLRYECDPGKNLFWASSENKEFVSADLAAGGTYVIVVDVVRGAWKARVGLSPIDSKDARFIRAKELVQEQNPVITPDSVVVTRNIKLAAFIKDKLARYENEWKKTKNYKHITADMAIPAEAMK